MSTRHSARFISLVIPSLLALASALATPAAAAECYTRQDLSARAPGFVQRVLAHDGDVVKKGDVLVELDARLLETAVREAKAGVDAAKAQLVQAEDGQRRLKQMAASDTVAPSELIAADAAVAQARAAHDRAKALRDRAAIMLDDATIKADVSGRVSGLPLVKNLYVQAGQSLGRIEGDAKACVASADVRQ
jgi:RND family efflux transporter MFP subunit